MAPKIDLFNIAADEEKIIDSIGDGTFRFASKQYAKYFAKSVAQGLIVGTVVTFAVFGAIAYATGALDVSEEDTE